MAKAMPQKMVSDDYLTEVEAAKYACVSPAQFRLRYLEEGIRPFWFMGRKLYRRKDIQLAMEKQRRDQLQKEPT